MSPTAPPRRATLRRALFRGAAPRRAALRRAPLRYAFGARALAAVLLLAAGAAAAQTAPTRPMLRGDIVAERDALTLGDLVADAPERAARTPVFRAPALGQTGTIQARRIIEAAAAAGIAIETGGRAQILVTRAARQVGPGEIEAALRRILEREAGLDPRATSLTFDGAPPRLVLAPEVAGETVAGDLAYDRRTRRFSASVWVGPATPGLPASARVSGAVVESVEVGVVNRAISRGDTIGPDDVTLERRPRDSVQADTLADPAALAGRVARRAFSAGTILRSGDLIRPELVARGDMVTVVYETPGMMLTMRAKSNDAGALGDTVSIVNPTSKKALQANVIGPGRVSVNLAPPGPLASAATRVPR